MIYRRRAGGRGSHFGGCGLLRVSARDCRGLRGSGARGHGAREGEPPPLVTAAKRQDFPHRVHREMGADPCPQTEAGPTPPPEWCGGRRHEVYTKHPSYSTVPFSDINVIEHEKHFFYFLQQKKKLSFIEITRKRSIRKFNRIFFNIP